MQIPWWVSKPLVLKQRLWALNPYGGFWFTKLEWIVVDQRADLSNLLYCSWSWMIGTFRVLLVYWEFYHNKKVFVFFLITLLAYSVSQTSGSVEHLHSFGHLLVILPYNIIYDIFLYIDFKLIHGFNKTCINSNIHEILGLMISFLIYIKINIYQYKSISTYAINITHTNSVIQILLWEIPIGEKFEPWPSLIKNIKYLGHLVGLIGRAWDSWFWGCMFEPQVGCTDFLKIKS